MVSNEKDAYYENMHFLKLYLFKKVSFKLVFNVEIIDDLADHMERTDESLVNKTQQVQNIHSKDRTFSYWVVILLLFIAIVVVALVK